jgi:hypothetical protein
LKADVASDKVKIGTEMDKRLWAAAAWRTICIEKLKSDAVALAWMQGQDEYGTQLGEGARARKLAEMEVWLRHLVGKFRIEGRRFRTPGDVRVRGTADCFGIGDGPGVSCVISAKWKDYGVASPFAVRPQVLLFGLDPGAMEIRVTHVDFVAIEMRGFLLDGVVNLEPESHPEILIPHPDVRRAVEDALRCGADNVRAANSGRGSFRRCGSGSPPVLVAPESLSPVPPKPLSRIALQPNGDVDMKFYVYASGALHTGLNQPVEFDLQLRRESETATNGTEGAQ